jgi:GntR family transcriptional regulator, transcriptional repressor for pyruvate dehydrogenase complex
VADPSGPDQSFPRRSAAADAAEKIKALITEGSLVAGSRLPPERDLCLRLAVSRPTLREAIRSLGTMGVLQSRQGAGTYVTDLAPITLAEPLRFMIGLNSRSLVELADVRRLLESGAAQLAATEIRPDELAELHAVIEELEMGTVHPDRFVELDAHFHRVVHVAARNGLLLALLDGMGSLADRSREITGRQPGLLAGTILAHSKIYDALAAHDPAAARLAMLEHLDEIRQVLQRMLEPAPEAESNPLLDG